MFIPPSINHVQTQNHRPDRIRSVRLSGFPICPKHLITPSRFSDYAVKLFNTRPATDKTIFPIRQPVGRAAPRLPDGRSQSRTGTPPRKQIHRKPQLFRQGRQPEPTLYVPYRQRSQKTQYARRSRPASLHRKRVRHQSQITRRRIGPVAVHARYRQALRLGKKHRFTTAGTTFTQPPMPHSTICNISMDCSATGRSPLPPTTGVKATSDAPSTAPATKGSNRPTKTCVCPTKRATMSPSCSPCATLLPPPNLSA